MPADQAIHFLLDQERLVRLSEPELVPTIGGLLACNLPLREEDLFPDRIILEAPRYLKPQGRLAVCGKMG